MLNTLVFHWYVVTLHKRSVAVFDLKWEDCISVCFLTDSMWLHVITGYTLIFVEVCSLKHLSHPLSLSLLGTHLLVHTFVAYMDLKHMVSPKF